MTEERLQKIIDEHTDFSGEFSKMDAMKQAYNEAIDETLKQVRLETDLTFDEAEEIADKLKVK